MPEQGRPQQTGMVMALALMPTTFQRTLMPRSTLDQALTTGICGAGSVFLCSHHHKMHRNAILAAGHQIRVGFRPVTSGFDGGLPHSSGLYDESRHRLYRCAIAVWTAL